MQRSEHRKMKIKTLTTALLTCVVLAACLPAAWAQPFASGWILVKFMPGTPASSVAAAHRLYGSGVIDDIPQIGVQRVTAPRGWELAHAARYRGRREEHLQSATE